MPIVSQGNSVVVDVGAHDGLWIKSTGSAEVTVNQVYAGTPEVINVTTETVRVGFYGEPVTVSIRAVSGNADYQDSQFSIQPLTAVQGGDRADSSPLDVKLAVNAISTKVTGASKIVGSIKTGGALSAYAAADRTLASTFLLKTRPVRARLRLLNSTNAAITGVAATIAPSANQTTWYLPSGGLSAFKTITIASTIPAATVGTGDSVVPVAVQSDWFAVNAIPRDDGGDGFILMLRVYQNTVGCKMQVGGSVSTSDFSRYECRIGNAASAGNFTTTSVVFNESGFNGPAFIMDFEFETPVATLAFVGDSIMAGANADPAPSGSSAFAAAFQAMKDLRSTGKNIQAFNAGWSGAPTLGLVTAFPDVIQGYLGQFMAYVNAGSRPSMAAICPWSVNNTGATNAYSATAVELAKQTAAVFVSFCQQNNIVPLLVTPAPVNGISEAFETARRTIVLNINSFAAQTGVTVVERDALYTNYNSVTGGFKSAEWCLDNTHPTQSGHEAEKSAWIEAINKLI